MYQDVMIPKAEEQCSAFRRTIEAGWLAACAATLVYAGTLAVLSPRFSGSDVAAMPVATLVTLMTITGCIFALCLPPLIRRSQALPRGKVSTLFELVLVTGVIARLVMFASVPILENDFQRYLWDGAVSAHGYNPYALSPATVIGAAPAGPLADVAQNATTTLREIGHRGLTTIYPPVAQAAFAIAHILVPWSLTAWRGLLLVCDLAIAALLVTLLDDAKRCRLWIALYWLNPIVLKEAFNSGHMEPLLMAFVLFAIYLAWRRRPQMASVALGLAAGIKLWPALVVPVVLHSTTVTKRAFIYGALIAASMQTVWLLALFSAAPGETPGLLAYAENWQTNSALQPALQAVLAAIASLDATAAGAASRFLLAGGAVVLALFLARSPWVNLAELTTRAGILITGLLLLSPAQYPWYAIWAFALLPFFPVRTLLVLTVTLPLYNLLFYFAARDLSDTFSSVVVWIIWVPVWIAALVDVRFPAPDPNIVRPQPELIGT